MAGTASEALDSRKFRFTREDTTVTTRWNITGTIDPHAASSATNLPAYGAAFGGDATLHATQCDIWRKGNGCEATVDYTKRTVTTRRIPGQTEDVYESVDDEYVMKYSLDETPIVLGEDREGWARPVGKTVWRRRQWRTTSNHATAEPLLWTRNVASFEGWAIGSLLFIRHRCAEIGNNFWEAEYEFKIDTTNLHAVVFEHRDPNTGLGDGNEHTAKVFNTADWSGLFT